MIRIPKWYLYHDSGLFRIMDPESYQTLLSNTIIRTFFFDYVKVFCALHYLFIFFFVLSWLHRRANGFRHSAD